MKWFRFYSEALDDPKVQDLPIATRWHWVEMLCIASSSEERGRIRPSRRLAARLNMTFKRLQDVILQLSTVGLLDSKDGYLVPHGWNKRQMASDDVATRVRKHRDVTLHETPLDTEAETDTEAEEETDKKPSPLPLTLEVVGGDTNMGLVFSLYERTFGSLNAHTKGLVEEAVERYSGNWVREAMEESAANEARNWAYAEAILRRWEQDEKVG